MTSQLPADLLSPGQQDALSQLEQQFRLDVQLMQRTLKQFLYEFDEGLGRQATKEEADTFLPMIPTFVHSVPNGSEVGDFLALDLGGTNLRVCSVTLTGDHAFQMIAQKYKVSDELKTGTADDLFDYIALSISQFLKDIAPDHLTRHHSKDLVAGHEEPLYMGFTFSFPAQQIALNSGTLINWTKGFTATGAQGKDVVKLLQASLDKLGINVYVSALVNDTVGTMLSRAYKSGKAQAGVIFGTGTNAAYLEKIEKIRTLKPEQIAKGETTMCINTEWGAFDNVRKVLQFTPFDDALDSISINPRKQAFEKMISGMYLGEIVRHVLLHLIKEKHLFGGQPCPALEVHYGFDSALMSAIEAVELTPNSTDFAHIRAVLETELAVPAGRATDADCVLVYRACELVGTRACRLSAVALTAMFRQVDSPKDGFAVGVDGSLVEFYPRFEQRVRQGLRDLVGEEEKLFEIGLAKDGSGVGAALTALQAKKQVDK